VRRVARPTESRGDGRRGEQGRLSLEAAFPGQRMGHDHLIELGVTNLRLRQDYAYQGGTQLAQDQRQADGRATH
jgi:hypothetical protein